MRSMDSDNFWMIAEVSLGCVMVLVILEDLAMDAQVFVVVGAFEYGLTDFAASSRNMSLFMSWSSNIMVVLNRTSGLKPVGTSLRLCLHTSLWIRDRSFCNHFVVVSKEVVVV